MDRQNSTTGGRRRVSTKSSSAEDQALNLIAIEAEARLAAKRAARVEAREIRLREIEKLNREADEAQDRRYHLINERNTDTRAYESVRSTGSCSRQDSEDSTDSTSTTSKEMKNLLHDLEDKLKKTMMTNAQLDNEKRIAVYQVDLLKDRLEEQDETLVEVQREYKEKCREFENSKRSYQQLEEECSRTKAQLEHRDKLIQENGLLIVTEESGELALRRTSLPNGSIPSGAALISSETAQLLKKGEGSLGTAVEIRTDTDSQLHDTLTLDSNTPIDRQLSDDVEVSYDKPDVVDIVNDIQTASNDLIEVNHAIGGIKNENNLADIIDSDENVNTTNSSPSEITLNLFSIEACNLNENSKNSIEVNAQEKTENNDIAIAISNGLELGKENTSESDQSEAVEECSEGSETGVPGSSRHASREQHGDMAVGTDGDHVSSDVSEHMEVWPGDMAGGTDGDHVSSDVSERMEVWPGDMAVGTDGDHIDYVEAHKEVTDIEIDLSDELDVKDVVSDLLDNVCLENKSTDDNISVMHAQDSPVDTDQMFIDDVEMQTAVRTETTAVYERGHGRQDVCVHTETAAVDERGNSRYYSVQESSQVDITASPNDSDESDDEAFEDARTDLPDVESISDESLKPMEDNMQSSVMSLKSDEVIHESPVDEVVIFQTPPRSEEDLLKSNDEAVPESSLDNQTTEIIAADGSVINTDNHHKGMQYAASGVDGRRQDMPGEIVLQLDDTNVNKMDRAERRDLETNDQPHQAMHEEDETDDPTEEQKEYQEEFYQNERTAAEVVDVTSLQDTSIQHTEEIIDLDHEITGVSDIEGDTTVKQESLTVNAEDVDEIPQSSSDEAVDNSASNPEEHIEYGEGLVANDGLTQIGVGDGDDKKPILVDNDKPHDNTESAGGTNNNLNIDDVLGEEAGHLGVVHLLSVESSPSTPSNSSFYEAEADRLLETSSMPDTSHSTSFTDTDDSLEISCHSPNKPTVDSQSIIAEAQHISCQSWVDDEILETDLEDHCLEKNVSEAKESYDEGSYVLDDQLIDVGNESSDTLKSNVSVSLNEEQVKDGADNLTEESEMRQPTEKESIAVGEEIHETEEQNSKEQGDVRADDGIPSTNTKEEQAKEGSGKLSLLDEVEQKDIIETGNELSGEISDETRDPKNELSSDAEISSKSDHPHAEISSKSDPPHAAISSKSDPPHVEISSQSDPPHAEISSQRDPPHAEISSQLDPPHAEIRSQRDPPHAEISSKSDPPHVEISSQSDPPHAEISSKSDPPHAEISSKSDPPHVEISSQSDPPHVEISSKSDPPHAEISSKSDPPHAEISSKSDPPRVEISSQSDPPHAEISSQRDPPHAEISSQRDPPHAEISSQSDPPHADISSQSDPHAEISSQHDPPHAEISSQRDPPHAEISSQSDPPHTEISSLSDPPHAEIGSQSDPHSENSSQSDPPNAEISSQRDLPHAEISSQRDPPHAEISSQSDPPQAEMSSQRDPPHSENSSQSDPPDAEISSQSDPPDVEISSQSGTPDVEIISQSDPPHAEISSQSDPPDAEDTTPGDYDSSSDEDDDESSLVYDFDDIEDVADLEPDVSAQDIPRHESAIESGEKVKPVKRIEANGDITDTNVKNNLAEPSSEIPVSGDVPDEMKSEKPTSRNEPIESPDELAFADSDTSIMSPSGYQGSREDVNNREKVKKSFFKKLFRSKKN